MILDCLNFEILNKLRCFSLSYICSNILKKAMYPVYKRCDRDYADNNFRYMLRPTPPLFNR